MSTAHESIAIEVWPSDDAHRHIFSLRGTFDLATAPTVRAALLDASQTQHHDIILDLTGIEFLDSTGLGTLIGSNRRARETGGRFAIVVGEGTILRLLRITGLLAALEVYPSIEAAIAGSERISDTLEPLDTDSART